jgi:type VI secretion system secreted protein VgrG
MAMADQQTRKTGTRTQAKRDLATQENRRLAVHTPLDDDFFLITRFSGMEAMSALFQFKLDLVVERVRIDSKDPSATDQQIQDLVGKKAWVSFLLEDQAKETKASKTNAGMRYFHGMIRRIMAHPADDRFLHYTMELVPWAWLLTQRTNSRIHQNKDVLEIVDAVFVELRNDFPLAKCEHTKFTRQLRKRDYCVQYQETDFNFISRLLEVEGLSFYFEHTADNHVMVVFEDSQTQLEFCAKTEAESAIPYMNAATADEKTIREWRTQREVGPGKFSSKAYHMQLAGKADESLAAAALAKDPFFHALETYEYTADYTVQFVDPGRRLQEIVTEGETLAEVRLDEQELPLRLMAGQSWWRNLYCGHKFKMTDHPNRTDNAIYVLLSVEYLIFQDQDYISGSETGPHPTFAFTCVPIESKIRPPRITPKPLMYGPQTARVSVKKGEESWLDSYGRVRVQFHWERNGKDNETSACWIRVSQSWAGNGWGAYFWPRLGDEVVVEFLEGDPDLPLITGSVFNAQNKPLYSLPINYTRSGILTRSSKGGGSQNFNELRFEDKMGQEQIFLNAERDMDHRVENDYRQFVGKNQHLIVQSAFNESIGADASRQITGNCKETIGGKLSLQVTGARHETVGNVYLVQAGDQIHLASGTSIVIEGGSEVCIKGPGGFVSIGPSGVTIQGTTVNVNSGGPAASGSSPSPDNPDKPEVADDGSKGTKLA